MAFLKGVAWVTILQKVMTYINQSIGEEIDVLTTKELKKQFARFFKKNTVLILGSKGAGKTSLIYLMQEGQPFRLSADGERIAPDPTLGTVLIDEKVEVSKEAKERWIDIAKDVSGDIDFRSIWQQLLYDVDPNGIVYMVDGRADEDSLRIAVAELFEDVLHGYSGGLRNLRTLHIFLNFSDEWGESKLDETRKANFVSEIFEEHRLNYAKLEPLKFHISPTQLSISENSWEEAERALEHFAADLS